MERMEESLEEKVRRQTNHWQTNIAIKKDRLELCGDIEKGEKDGTFKPDKEGKEKIVIAKSKLTKSKLTNDERKLMNDKLREAFKIDDNAIKEDTHIDESNGNKKTIDIKPNAKDVNKSDVKKEVVDIKLREKDIDKSDATKEVVDIKPKVKDIDKFDVKKDTTDIKSKAKEGNKSNGKKEVVDDEPKAKPNDAEKNEIDDVKDIVKGHNFDIIASVKEWKIDIIEKIYDNNIPKYQHSIDNPMIYVGKYKNGYRMRCDNVVETAKNNTEICEKALKILCTENKDTKLIIGADKKMMIGYVKCLNIGIPVYWYNNKPYFDIHHILFLIDLKNKHEKLKEYNDQIEQRIIFKNEFGGYDIRELISRKTMIEMLLNGRTEFAKLFKKSIAELLDKLCEKGIVSLDNTGQFVVDETKNEPKNESTSVVYSSDNNKEVMLNTMNESRLFSFKNINDSVCIEKLIKSGKKINLGRYLDTSLMYFLISTLQIKDLDERQLVVIKIGFTTNITARLLSLKADYKCDFFVCDLKCVKDITKEQKFHKQAKAHCPELLLKAIVNCKERDELYILSDKIIELFEQIKEVDSEIKRELNNQEHALQDMISKQYDRYIMENGNMRVIDEIAGILKYNLGNKDEILSTIRRRDKYGIKCQESIIKHHETMQKQADIRLAEISLETENLKSMRAIELEKEKNRGLEIQKAMSDEKEKEITKREIEIANRRNETDILISNNKLNINVKNMKKCIKLLNKTHIKTKSKQGDSESDSDNEDDD